jgi:hypothetical protein
MAATMNGETLVMTATFRAPDTPTLVVRDEQTRMLHYLCALTAWARPARVRRIVFAENSGTPFDFSRVVSHLESAGKQVEILLFDGNRQSAVYGKGYGEGKILEHVFRTSRLLPMSDVFYKVTGRLFVRNFDAVSERTSRSEAFRFKVWDDPNRKPKIMTAFFKCSRAVFESHLLDAYCEVDDRTGVHIEHVYYNRMHRAGLDDAEFPVKPRLVGQQASTGDVYSPYDDEIVETARALMLS